MIMHQWFRSIFMETWVGFLDSPKGQRILNGTGATRANMVEQEYYLSNTSAFFNPVVSGKSRVSFIYCVTKPYGDSLFLAHPAGR